MSAPQKKPPHITIRPFTMTDYDAVLALWDSVHLPYKPHGRDSRTTIQEQLTFPCTIYLVAELNGTIIGTLFGTNDGRKGWINRLAVAPAYQHKGVAATLVAAIEKRFSDLGIDITAALIEDWNTDSLLVFEKLKYTKHQDIIYFSRRKNPEV